MWPWLASAGVGLVGLLLWLWEKAAHADSQKDLALTKAQNKDLSRQLHEAWDMGERKDKVITLLRGDLHGLNEELEKCAVPGAVRERLNKLLTKSRLTE